MNEDKILIKRIVTGVVSFVLLTLSLIFAGNLFETVEAGQLVVKQGLMDGKLTVWNAPGLQWQGGGKLTTYKRSDQYFFNGAKDEDAPIKVRFNDFGHATISGGLRYDLPTDEDAMRRLHSTYGSQDSVERSLIAPAVVTAIYMVGPLMSSTDSASSRRSDLLSLAEDQLTHGVYKQRTKQEKVKDAITGAEKTVSIVELISCTAGSLCVNGFERQERSPLTDAGIRVYNLSYAAINYEDKVERQIHAQQEAKAAVETAIANSKRAEQDALTAIKQGEALVAKAKAAQDVDTANAVGAAQRERETTIIASQRELEKAKLDAQAADNERKASILRAEGEATAARLKQQASNFQQEKINAWIEVQKAWAAAFTNARLTPEVVMGGSSQGPSGLQFMDLMTAKAAKDLGLKMTQDK